MAYRQSMLNILVVSGAKKGEELLRELLTSYGCTNVTVCANGGEARRRALEMTYDTIIINTPLMDEFGSELARDLSETTVAGILLLTRNDLYEEMMEQVIDYGVMSVSKPLHRELFFQTLNLAIATRERLKILEKENHKLKVKLDETRLIDRAKYILMESMQMSEMQAHKYIERQAMDLRLTRCAIAENILRTY